ncbi:MAG TPA: hypothetical protein VFQ39_15940 [Longimicrobium sp.]|nr:hypothetical protein [Longimicrobium sp.]
MRAFPSAATAALLLTLAACADRATAPDLAEPPAEAVAALQCTARVGAATVTCAPLDGGPSLSVSPGGGARRLIVGGQGVNVRLTSSNVAYDAATGTFSADVTVQNLLPEALGTGDRWTTLTGVRVFFHQEPAVTGGGGTVEVANPDGEGLFTGSRQPYFAWDEVLPPNAVSSPKRWRWNVGPGVAEFSFQLYVDADREDEGDGDTGAGRYQTLSAGSAHACALTPSGDAWCWGANGFGQLGNATREGSNAPTAVVGGRHWMSVSAGMFGSCGTDNGGETWCWGHFTAEPEVEGEPGCPGYADPCQPVRVLGAEGFHLVSAGNHHSCAVGRDGRGWCWGLDASGQLGSSANADRCQLSSPDVPCARRPVEIDGGLRFNDIVAGHEHTCALARGGDAYCWGFGRAGQRGDGGNGDSETPVPVAGGIKFSMVDTFMGHTCGLTPDGQAWCWGANSDGESAQPDVQRLYYSPVAVPQGNLKFREVAVGFDHTCALERTGEAWCWGGNFFGQLGDGAGGDWAYSTVPVPVAGGMRFRDLDAGHQFTCGITRDGEAWCWGHNIGGFASTAPASKCHFEPCALVPSRVADPAD